MQDQAPNTVVARATGGAVGVGGGVSEGGATCVPPGWGASWGGKLGLYKWRGKIVGWDALPRTGYGKVP